MTLLCGVGHVLSSIVLGLIGISFGVALFKLEAIEAFRGDIAAWFLVAFGFTYFVWGLWRALKKRPHEHVHTHADGVAHSHSHGHTGSHGHVHAAEGKGGVTPWVLFLIFIFGPCEPLIPLVMFPAAKGNMFHIVTVAAVFGVVTVGTMLCVVMVSYYGLSRLPSLASGRLSRVGRFSHAAAGLVLLMCGSAIAFLGL